MNFHRSPWLAAVVASCILGSAPAAQAGAVIATAVENPYTAVEDKLPLVNELPGAVAHAVSPNNNNLGGSSATASRLRVSASSDGAGAGPQIQNFHAASASSFTSYELWDITNNTLLASAQAKLLDLTFNFHLLSSLSVPTRSDGLDVGSMSYSAQVVSLNSAVVREHAGNVSKSVGSNVSSSGNLSLLGLVDLSFSLQHEGSSTGQFSMAFGNSGANDVTGAGTLWLESITLAPPSQMAGRNLGVRFTDNGAIYAFGQDLDASNPVSEPASGALVLLALAWFTQRRASRIRR